MTAPAGNGTTGAPSGHVIRAPVDLVALDMDGTILENGRTVDPAVVAAIRTCRERGLRFVTASGRPYDFQVAVLERHGLQGAFSGLVCDEREIWLPATQSGAGAADFEGWATWNAPVQARWELLADEAWRWMLWGQAEARAHAHEATIHLSRAEVQRRGLAVVALGTPDDARDLARITAGRLRAQAPALACNRNGRLVQIHDARVDKAGSVAALAARLGVEPARVQAVGDSANDLTMLSGTHGFLPGTVANADPEVTAAVLRARGRVATGSYGAGVAELLTEIFLTPAVTYAK